MTNGWAESAAAWIADMGEQGDFGRRHVLDAPMQARIAGRGYRTALDVGCGEGRFCRALAASGIVITGIDPTPALLAAARDRDPDGDYRLASAEALPFADAQFDLVISYLSLIDIPDVATAIAEMARVLAPGGTLLIANLNGFKTAQSGGLGQDYGDEWASWEEWRGIRVQNWHRPLSRYMTLLLGAGLVLRHFDEPLPTGGEPAKAARYRRLPWYLIMEWQKPELSPPAPT
ncbi:MAG: SAM-dependent methyltransferase [Alphaproteobacteria bacterium PA4]|nr:MAG: SAM-dependent methyltransferase [Alphaproteobacteria bacterium PA4]